MTRIERIQQRIGVLEEKRALAMRSHRFTEMMSLNAKIEEARNALEEARLYEPMELGKILSSDELTKNKVYLYLVEILLAADYLNSCALEAKSVLKKLGVANFTMYDDIRSIYKLTDKISQAVCTPDLGGMTDFMVEDDVVIDQFHNIARNHIENNLIPTTNEE